MLYQDIIDNIRDLGFGDDDDIDDFGELIPNSINRAITEINLNVCPIMDYAEIEIFSKEDEGHRDDPDIIYIDMNDICKTLADGTPSFLDFADTPVLFSKTRVDIVDGERKEVESLFYERFTNFEVEMGHNLVIKTENKKGKYRIYYKKAHEPYTLESESEDKVELPLKVHHLIPLLASYYVWAEDDAARAEEFRQLYLEKKTEASAEINRPKGRILEGGI